MTCVGRIARITVFFMTAGLGLGLLAPLPVAAQNPPIIALPDGVFVNAGQYDGVLHIEDHRIVGRADRDEAEDAPGEACGHEVRSFASAAWVPWEAVTCLGLTLPAALPYIPLAFEPLLNVTAAPATDSVRIILDAGHGGEDSGAVGVDGILEKDITLAVARAMYEMLAPLPGFQVYMTRTNDRFVTLRDRAEMANRLQADLFISLHGNAGFQEKARGVEIFIAGHRADDARSRELARLENSVEGEAFLHAGDTVSVLADLALADQLQHSAHTAAGMLTAMTRDLEVADRGVKRAPFWVLLGANMPAVLVETGFLTNLNEGRRLADPEYQERIAQSLVSALEEMQPSLLNRRVRSSHGPIVRQEGGQQLASP